jgi:hypothetical protein
MHWPENRDIQRVDTNDAIIILKEGATVDPEVFSPILLSDLLRASVTMAVSAMDAYYHAKIVDNVGKVLRANSEFPPALNNVKMTIEDYVEACTSKYKRVAIGNAVDKSLGYKALQKPSDIAGALKIIGIEDFWTVVGRELGSDADSVKAQLSTITKRRHVIVHEGDLVRSKKTGNRSRTIEPGFTETSIDFIKTLVEASEVVIDRDIAARA